MNMKLKYERPETERLIVEMEAAFCAGSGDEMKEDNNGLKTEDHVAGGAFDAEQDANDNTIWE